MLKYLCYRLNLELFAVKDVMSSPVTTIKTQDSVSNLASVLLNTSHGGFPITSEREDGTEYFVGLINRYY